MQTADDSRVEGIGRPPDDGEATVLAFIGRLLVTLAIPLLAFLLIYGGFIFLRDSAAPQWVITVVAIVWGVGGIGLLYWLFNAFVERLPLEWTARLQPFVFAGPAMAVLFAYLMAPTIYSFYLSLFGRNVQTFVGLDNYATAFTHRLMVEAFRNNLMWIVFGSTFSVVFGLMVAVLADRSNWERVAKSLIFLPMAISFVGAGVIWNFIYAVRPGGDVQIGLLNAIVAGLGGEPHSWPAWTEVAPWNNLFLIIIVIWLQTGFAMVLFSAALKGIPNELLEAGRVDGANEFEVFFQIMIPYIMGTIITVWTTIIIFTLKIFDVVWVMTGGQFGTEVIATQFYRQSFVAGNMGLGSAIAMILLIAVIPVMIYNLKQFREQEAF
jgi:alpha-glucoside transport system permease protein